MNEDNATLPTELDELKERADVLGLKYRKDITLETLKAKVAEQLAEKEAGNDKGAGEEPAQKETAGSKKVSQTRTANELVRVRITCMDPSKREYDGDIFCAGNRFVGTFKKYVPFDTEWHVPRIILNMIKRKKCQVFVSKRDSRGRPKRESKLIKAYNVEILDPLTKDEIKELAQRQAMAKGTAAA